MISIPVASELLVTEIRRRLGLSPYNIIVGKDTALPWTLYHFGATRIDITSVKSVTKSVAELPSS